MPFYRWIELNADDILRRSIIQSLMCHFELSMSSVENMYRIEFKEYFFSELESLRDLERGGLLRIEDKRIIVLSSGRMLVRAISMVFDKYLNASREVRRYSKVI
jgi:oxygen-independent coproporphyrinogen-3 oxidase